MCIGGVLQSDGRRRRARSAVPAGRSVSLRAWCRRDGRVLAAGESGQIELKGPNVMREYFQAPELTAQTLSSDGWLATGDLGYL